MIEAYSRPPLVAPPPENAAIAAPPVFESVVDTTADRIGVVSGARKARSRVISPPAIDLVKSTQIPEPQVCYTESGATITFATTNPGDLAGGGREVVLDITHQESFRDNCIPITAITVTIPGSIADYEALVIEVPGHFGDIALPQPGTADLNVGPNAPFALSPEAIKGISAQGGQTITFEFPLLDGSTGTIHLGNQLREHLGFSREAQNRQKAFDPQYVFAVKTDDTGIRRIYDPTTKQFGPPVADVLKFFRDYYQPKAPKISRNKDLPWWQRMFKYNVTDDHLIQVPVIVKEVNVPLDPMAQSNLQEAIDIATPTPIPTTTPLPTATPQPSSVAGQESLLPNENAAPQEIPPLPHAETILVTFRSGTQLTADACEVGQYCATLRAGSTSDEPNPIILRQSLTYIDELNSLKNRFTRFFEKWLDKNPKTVRDSETTKVVLDTSLSYRILYLETDGAMVLVRADQDPNQADANGKFPLLYIVKPKAKDYSLSTKDASGAPIAASSQILENFRLWGIGFTKDQTVTLIPQGAAPLLLSETNPHLRGTTKKSLRELAQTHPTQKVKIITASGYYNKEVEMPIGAVFENCAVVNGHLACRLPLPFGEFTFPKLGSQPHEQAKINFMAKLRDIQGREFIQEAYVLIPLDAAYLRPKDKPAITPTPLPSPTPHSGLQQKLEPVAFSTPPVAYQIPHIQYFPISPQFDDEGLPIGAVLSAKPVEVQPISKVEIRESLATITSPRKPFQIQAKRNSAHALQEARRARMKPHARA